VKKEQGVWLVEAVGYVEKGIVERLARFNRRFLDERSISIERLVQELLRSVKEKRQPGTWFVEEDRLLLTPEDEPNAVFRVLLSFVAAKNTETALDKSEAAASKQALQPHLDAAAYFAKNLGEKLNLPEDIRGALLLAAGGHDWGKHRRPWQRAIGNTEYPRVVLAKSDHRRFNNELCKNYRHEFGSLVRATREPPIGEHLQRELICHLIAAHHGWARPHFRSDLDDPEADSDQIASILAETPRIYARLQRSFGRWGLAWLEALLKSADVMATKGVGLLEEDDSALPEKEIHL
jgi:CRISPR-associated endonuclease/helicase Cas3